MIYLCVCVVGKFPAIEEQQVQMTEGLDCENRMGHNKREWGMQEQHNLIKEL